MTRFNNLQDWLNWQEGLHSRAIDLGLDRVRAVAAKMQLLQPAAKIVTVAGTNGKGSCVATLEALLVARGVSVGAFTSPHFHRYNERLRVDGQELSDSLICESFQRIDSARGDISLTYFEFGALAALDLFRRQRVEVMLLEVGLGGRLDAVNILDADIAVVTSIALDHQDWLGSDLQQIGREKAGIYRPGRWAICADQQAPGSVEATAKQLGARWLAMGAGMQIDGGGSAERWTWRGIDDSGSPLQLADLPRSGLPLASVAAALQAYVLLGYRPGPELGAVLAGVTLPGRSQVIERDGVSFILDVAHNPAAAGYQAQQLAATGGAGRTWCLCAIMADKDQRGIFEVLLPQVDGWHVCDLPGVARAASATDLLATLQQTGGHGQTHPSVEAGLQSLLATVERGDRVLVMGSFFTVAAAQSFFESGSPVKV
ncbi:bifunctional tetrahydrofolate synthase/dihydrofolate synthase [Pseudomaricurvus alcaniphilus]|uniref:bifunctional tetrahydrofolate synthase/dihydrofolate synthase n=1 Tax=Pseudomaricurvus alcaniphilus TaxID=1166482 RepID=UPI0014075ED5|nr:bifunctional tetrahydrofolate synthase/dihydrofolate synthase [Pseudomaricurvus alcaniphilus]NHN37454.1 bifunctional tetrahydrofolate synthase/dihydrofolate synthase [Pseudomaricurvus alcaniphilus]